MQTLTADYLTDLEFFWVPESEASDYEMEGEGWFDPSTGCAAEKLFTVGEGYVLMNDFGDGVTIQYAGQVPNGTTEFPLPAAVSLAGNATPVEVDIQSIVLKGEVPGGAVQMQTLTADYLTDLEFFWVPESEASDYEMEGEGWYDPTTGVAAEKIFAPGEGFVLLNDVGEGVSVVLPSPL